MAKKFHVRTVEMQEEWDALVWDHHGGNVFCAWPWGEYKVRTGWRVQRVSVLDEAGDILALFQHHERHVGRLRLLRVQGGPLLTEKGERLAEGVFGAFFDHVELGRLDLLAMDFERTQSAGSVLAALAKGFKPVVNPVRHTLDVDLTVGLDTIKRDMEPRWRKALRRAETWPGLSVRFVEDVRERLACFDAFSTMYEDLKLRAKFKNSLDLSSYRDLAASDAHLLFVEVREEGEVVLVRIAHLSRERCTDFLTASTERARASQAATLAVWRLIERARIEGCRAFDHGGIDPSSARGVYDFKVGLTRNVVQSGPLWLYSRTELVARLLAAYCAWR